jgi:hypothetical protein
MAFFCEKQTGLCPGHNHGIQHVDQFGQAEFANQIRRHGDKVIVPMGQRLAQRLAGCLRWLVTEFLQSSELLFKAALAGHVGKFSAF